MASFVWLPDDFYKANKTLSKHNLGRYYLEETKSMDSNLDTESMVSYLSSANDIHSTDSLDHSSAYETVDPLSRSERSIDKIDTESPGVRTVESDSNIRTNSHHFSKDVTPDLDRDPSATHTDMLNGGIRRNSVDENIDVDKQSGKEKVTENENDEVSKKNSEMNCVLAQKEKNEILSSCYSTDNKQMFTEDSSERIKIKIRNRKNNRKDESRNLMNNHCEQHEIKENVSEEVEEGRTREKSTNNQKNVFVSLNNEVSVNEKKNSISNTHIRSHREKDFSKNVNLTARGKEEKTNKNHSMLSDYSCDLHEEKVLKQEICNLSTSPQTKKQHHSEREAQHVNETGSKQKNQVLITAQESVENITGQDNKHEQQQQQNIVYVRLDQSVNKVSPLEQSSSIQQGHQKSTKQESFRKTTQRLSTDNKILNSNENIVQTNMLLTTSREDWTKFDDESSAVSTAELSSPNFVPTSPLDSTASQALPSQQEWVAFEDHTTQHGSTDIVTVDHVAIDSDESKLLVANTPDSPSPSHKKETTTATKASSTEDLLDVVNRTVSLIRNITKSDPDDEEKSLFKSNPNAEDDANSELSDEVISLDYESEEENKKLRDTPVKQFTDVSLFRASLVKDSNKVLNSMNVHDSNTINVDEPLHDYPNNINRKSWSFWFRYPDRKKLIGKRKWSPVTVTVDGDYIKLESETNTGLHIHKEIPLQPYFVFTMPVLHTGNKDGRMRSVKLQYVKYRELRKLKPRMCLEHAPVYTPVLKVASRDVTSLKEFTEKVENIIRRLPTRRDKGITYRHEEIFIDCDDDCRFLLTGDGSIMKYNITTLLRLRVFVSGNPEFKLFLNDINNKEILTETKENLLRDTKKTRKWISPERFEYHPCVEKQKTKSEGGIVFTPPDGCSFELLRYRVRKKGQLPIIATSSLELLTGNSVRLHATVQATGDAKSLRHKRNDVIMYFPIPPAWSMLFVRSTTLAGTKKYLKTNQNTKMKGPVAATLSRVTFQVSCGKAKYEPALGSIVWRLDTLPIIQDGIPADVTHTFQCYLELPFPLEIRDEFQPLSYIDFNIASPYASDTTVEEILLSDGRVPDKWVCYRANYSYTISMTLIENGKVRKK